MDPNSNLTMPGSSELPPPVQPEAPLQGPDNLPPSAETAGIAAEQAPMAQQGAQTMPLPTGQQPNPTAFAPPVASPSVATASDMPDVAEDSDLIEQEWVHKAKEIVERTKADPHAQNKEINKVKADYIKKRYNREIKVNEA